jgi:putative membrane protein
MSDAVVESLERLPYFIAYFGIALLMLTLALALHVALTRVPETRLLLAGNTAAAASLAGAVIGFALPLAAVIAVSGTLLDMAIWAVVALALQLLVVTAVRIMVPALGREVAEGRVASGVFLGTIAVAIGLLNAASIAYR